LNFVTTLFWLTVYSSGGVWLCRYAFIYILEGHVARRLVCCINACCIYLSLIKRFLVGGNWHLNCFCISQIHSRVSWLAACQLATRATLNIKTQWKLNRTVRNAQWRFQHKFWFWCHVWFEHIQFSFIYTYVFILLYFIYRYIFGNLLFILLSLLSSMLQLGAGSQGINLLIFLCELNANLIWFDYFFSANFFLFY